MTWAWSGWGGEERGGGKNLTLPSSLSRRAEEADFNFSHVVESKMKKGKGRRVGLFGRSGKGREEESSSTASPSNLFLSKWERKKGKGRWALV